MRKKDIARYSREDYLLFAATLWHGLNLDTDDKLVSNAIRNVWSCWPDKKFPSVRTKQKFNHLPISEMPLHLNSADRYCSTIAKWRLEIGK
jgi:hypothetical protein